VQGISDLITVHGLVNLDFADVKTVMADAGSALMGIGRASGENRAVEAAQQAIGSPLLEVSIDGARGVLFNVIGGSDMSMHEINTVAETITAAADPEANIIFGASINPDLEGEIIVTVVATGFEASYFASRDRKTAELIRQATEEPAVPEQKIDEETMAGLDMDISEPVETTAHDFHSDETPNIWTLTDDVNGPAGDTEAEQDLERPSFLRRAFGIRPGGSPKSDDLSHAKVDDDQQEGEPDQSESEKPDEPKHHSESKKSESEEEK